MAINIEKRTVGMYQENAYVVGVPGRDDCVVIDPGDGHSDLLEAIGRRRVGAILLTHGHFDHTLAAQPLAEAFGAPVYVHEEELAMLNDTLLNAFDPSVVSMPMKKIEKPVLFGDSLSACGLEFEILHTPGHSMGSVCLYLPSDGVLFSGDTLFEAGYGRMDLYGGSVDEMIRSLKRLFELPGETRVYPGHGGMTTIARERGRYRM